MDSRFSMLVGLNRNERESPRLQCHVSARHPPAPPLNKSRPDRWVCGQSGHSLETQFDVQNSRLPAANGRGSGPNINNVRSCKSIGVLIVSGRRLSRLDDIPRLAHMEACRLGIAIDILLACCRCRSDQEKPARSEVTAVSHTPTRDMESLHKNADDLLAPVRRTALLAIRSCQPALSIEVVRAGTRRAVVRGSPARHI